MRVEEIRALGNEELVKHLDTTQKQLFDLRFRLATRQLVNHREIRKVKKDIARLKTIIRERELGLERASTK